MAYRHNFEKPQYVHNGLSDFDETGPHQPTNFQDFKFQRWNMAATLKIEKIAVSQKLLLISVKSGIMMHTGLLNPMDQKKI